MFLFRPCANSVRSCCCVNYSFPASGYTTLFVVAGAVGISRIILTSHYLSDVIAGAGIGILLTMAVKYFFDRKQIKLTVE
ncbi:MAG: phosphatase PAP2 family protein [Smithella sp.]